MAAIAGKILISSSLMGLQGLVYIKPHIDLDRQPKHRVKIRNWEIQGSIFKLRWTASSENFIEGWNLRALVEAWTKSC